MTAACEALVSSSVQAAAAKPTGCFFLFILFYFYVWFVVYSSLPSWQGAIRRHGHGCGGGTQGRPRVAIPFGNAGQGICRASLRGGEGPSHVEVAAAHRQCIDLAVQSRAQGRPSGAVPFRDVPSERLALAQMGRGGVASRKDSRAKPRSANKAAPSVVQ